MKKFLVGLAALPFVAGVASAGQLLTNAQMDAVTAGFSATSLADAASLGPVTSAASGTRTSVLEILKTTLGEATMTAVRSNAHSSSTSTAVALPAATVLPTSR
jgi:hypothetical protein